jgi:adenylate cyclase class IV
MVAVFISLKNYSLFYILKFKTVLNFTMDLVFIILIIILCVLIAFYVKTQHRKTAGGSFLGGWFGQRRVIGGGKEIEARWLDIDIDEMRNKIEELGGELVHDEKQYRRYVYSLDSDTEDVKIEGKKNAKMTAGDSTVSTKNTEKQCKDFVKAVKSKGNGYVRTREEYRGNDVVVTMTCKLYGKGKHADEYELLIDGSLDDGKAFLDALGLAQRAYHETRRIKYKAGKLKNINELVLDTIPGMPPYIEVEAKNEKAMFDTAKSLGLEKGKEHYGPYGKTFADVYGFTQSWFDNFEGDGLNELTFGTFAEAMMPHITKNKEMFEKAVKMFSDAKNSVEDDELKPLEEVGESADSPDASEGDEGVYEAEERLKDEMDESLEEVGDDDEDE